MKIKKIKESAIEVEERYKMSFPVVGFFSFHRNVEKNVQKAKRANAVKT